ncbi:ATP-dependent nuclease [Burkholderia cepacia]|uniref:ATP-dependent nuclease n=1 Tax=Burkholderia cepacia TaxID=292 RepID=UPI002AB74ABB|nr:AAA family ATPase [Burkholderia cepacia]
MAFFENSSRKDELGYEDNKEIPIKSIAGIEIKNFRSLKDRTVRMGSQVTVISGRNGTMKTSIMGLIAHPFTSNAIDAFGKPLKTTLRNVFKLSPDFDKETYEYNLVIDTGKDTLLSEPVQIYPDSTDRHRVVVSGAKDGDGNFTYNTSFLNLRRLFPLIDTRAEPISSTMTLKNDEGNRLKDYYETIFPSSAYDQFTPVSDAKGTLKTTFAPAGNQASYDWHSISSGEDNLGAIFNRLIGFQRTFDKKKKTGNGILCIDEFESSLHPVAQLRLFDYLYRWSGEHNVQVVISTHSLHLISHVYAKHAPNLTAGRVVLNFVSKSTASNKNYPILHNPPYDLAYKELTLQNPVQAAEARKVNVYCEDDLAIHFVKRIVKSRNVLNAINFHSSLDPESEKPGTGYSALRALCTQYPLLLENSLVIFDADVPSTVTDKIKNKTLFLKLPDADNLAIERRIIAFIVELENDDPFFNKFNREQEAFFDSFKQSGIKSLTPSHIKDESKINIDACKRWADSDKAAFKRYVTYYCDHHLDGEKFQNDFINRLNSIISSFGLPNLTS